MKLHSSRIAGTGSAFPKRVVTNEDLCSIIRDFPGEVPENFGSHWILERTGIESRHFVSGDETLSSLAFEASGKACSAAGISPAEIDGIILATCTPDQPMPAAATLLQSKLGATHAFAFDINAACSGFHHAWAMGHSLIASGQAKTLLIVGADVLTSITDFTDRKSGILFGDGAGAMILTRDEDSKIPPRFSLTADGRSASMLGIPAGGSARPAFSIEPRNSNLLTYSETRMQMEGHEIFKTSVRTMVELSGNLLREMDLTADSIDWVVPHQANLRILELVAKRQKISINRFILNIQKRGNTSAATVPTALDEGIRDGRIQRGNRLLVPVFGAGVTAGAAVVTY